MESIQGWLEKIFYFSTEPTQLPGSAYSLVETKPPLPVKVGQCGAATKMASIYDMVEPMSYLCVSVVKARDLPTMDITGALDPYVEVKLGNFKSVTRHLEKNANPVWRQMFTFSAAHLQSNQLEVIVRHKDVLRADFVGRVVFDMSDIPSCIPPDSQLAPQWYHLSDAHGERFPHGNSLGEIMLAVWLGTQPEETFLEAWHSGTHSLSRERLMNTRSKVYYSPKLIYLKVFIITAQDLFGADKDRPLAAAIAKIQIGNQIRRTRPGQLQGSANPAWNEEFMFVVSEPFEDPLVVTVEEKVVAGRDEPISRVIIPVASPYVPRNGLVKSVPSKWFTLLRRMTVDEAAADVTTGIKHREHSKTFTSKIQLRMSLETAYHVLDESTCYISDLHPAAKLRKSAIGILKVEILGARDLAVGVENPYVVAKYGRKWVRTRTLLNTTAPQWNEQHTWDVFDVSTVITIAVFNDSHGVANDQRIGKVRIRVATLETDRMYTQYYPLMVLTPSGLKKMGQLHLAVRFTCKSWPKMLAMYGKPLLPELHHTNPIPAPQMDYLRFKAMEMVASRLGRAQHPLRREVVESMLDFDNRTYMFSLRRSKANFYRITLLFSGGVAVAKWLDGICKWKNPPTTILVHVVFLKLVCCPELILPVVFLCMIIIGAWNYFRRPRRAPNIDTVLSCVELAHPNELDEEFDGLQPPHIDAMLRWYNDVSYPDELDEEFDTFPTSKPDDIVRLRYERLRSLFGMVQTVVGDLAAQGERAQLLLRWHDPRLTPVFIALSLVMPVVLYLTPFRVVAMVMVLYFLRPPWFRGRTNLLLNLYSRLPSSDDVMP
ncbi:FT-interacting protein 7-like [Triticum dicoccoides]|uniref:FT-interacting protein 7-like n=1 Tax=Triticum dicoccoides TaxID=85692 RepID=UPI00188FBC2F|nr:FT-interacting protein 7-like [Triticum dicoccoides]